jgi:hypothetical protein
MGGKRKGGQKPEPGEENFCKKIANVLELQFMDRHDWSRTRWNLFLVKRQDRNRPCQKERP